MRSLIFLSAEAAVFTFLLTVSWFLARRAFALLEVRIGPPSAWTPLAVWALLIAVNVAFTARLGPRFTVLYLLSGLSFLGACGLYLLCLTVRRHRPSSPEGR